MSGDGKRSGERAAGAAARLVVCAAAALLAGQSATLRAQSVTTNAPPVNADPTLGGPGVLADRVVAVVNGDLVLESDLDQERRLEAFEPFSASGAQSEPRTRKELLQRLIDRTLILQQAKLQPDDGLTPAAVQQQLDALRKEIPACKVYQCETSAGWEKFVQAQGFTLTQLAALWKQRMAVLDFVELRFRSGIDITPEQIKTYYEKTMLPEYARRHVTKPPTLATLSPRIQEVLLEQQVSSLLSDWLESLKAQGTVRVIEPGQVSS